MEGISTNLLLLNGLLTILLIIYFAQRHLRKKPSPKPKSEARPGLKKLAEELKTRRSEGEGAQILPFERPSQPEPVIFNWNGHSWDAFEVLGVSADADLAQVRTVYEAAIEKMDDESKAFLHKAYQAIQKQAKN